MPHKNLVTGEEEGELEGHRELALTSASLGWLRAPPGLGWSPAGLQNVGAALTSLRAP